MFKGFKAWMDEVPNYDLKSQYCITLNRLINRDLRDLRIDSRILQDKLVLLRRQDIPEFEFEDEYYNLLPMLEETIAIYNRSLTDKSTIVKCHRNIRLILNKMDELNKQIVSHYDSSQLDTIYDIISEREEMKENVTVDDFFQSVPKPSNIGIVDEGMYYSSSHSPLFDDEEEDDKFEEGL